MRSPGRATITFDPHFASSQISSYLHCKFSVNLYSLTLELCPGKSHDQQKLTIAYIIMFHDTGEHGDGGSCCVKKEKGILKFLFCIRSILIFTLATGCQRFSSPEEPSTAQHSLTGTTVVDRCSQLFMMWHMFQRTRHAGHSELQ